MKQIVIVCGVILAVISGIDAGKWYKTDEGNCYFIETERKADYYSSMRACQNMNYTSYLVYMDAIGQSDKQQIEILAKKLAAANNTDIWTAGYVLKDPKLCPSLLATEHSHCDTPLGYICGGKPPSELTTLITPNDIEVKATSEELRSQLETLDDESCADKTNELQELKKSYTLQTLHVLNITSDLQDVKNSYDHYKNLLIEKMLELDEMKKSCKLQIDLVLKDKAKELNEVRKSLEAQVLEEAHKCNGARKSPEMTSDGKEISVGKSKNETVSYKNYHIIFRHH